MRHFLWITCAVAMCGCSTLSDVRESQPVRTLSFAGTYDAVAECIARGIDAMNESPPVLRLDRESRSAHVWRMAGEDFAVYDIEVAQAGERVAVYGRGVPTVGGRDLQVARVWPAVEGCAGR